LGALEYVAKVISSRGFVALNVTYVLYDCKLVYRLVNR